MTDNAAHNLLNLTLQTGWFVKEKIEKTDNQTGSFFSVCYKVEKDGEICFLKAYDFAKFLTISIPGSKIVDVMNEMLTAYQYERDLSEYCKNRHVTKVSFVKEAGEEVVMGYAISIVPYLIFDMADGDIRKKLDLPQISNSYNRLSIISNICLTDFNKEVYFFDNVLNSLILDNSIYINNSVDCFSHIKHKYVYSNDVYGIKKFEDRIKSDLAFDWKKFLKENKIKNKIYDILDLYKYEIKNEVKFDLEKYFYGNK